MRREDDPELDAEDRALIARLRALPAETGEPDWAALERQIEGALPAEVPRRWWRRWRWLLPVGTLAAAAAIALVWLVRAPHGDAPTVAATPPPVVHHEPPLPAEPAMSMWLGGEVVDIDDLDAALPDDDLDSDALATDNGAGPGSILPAGDPAWIDQLDDNALDRAEALLERKKG
ncbi:MAG: hypothetical protein ACM31C_24965 [Acidobacteriota bacterium]